MPHHGIAVDHCLTFSVGMRAPSAAELLGDFVDTLAADAPEDLRYTDPGLAPASDANEIDGAAMARVVEALNLLRMNDADALGDWFGAFITTYRCAVEPAADDAGRARIEVEWDLAHGAVILRHPWSRMAWRRAHGKRGGRLYAGGRVLALPGPGWPRRRVRAARCRPLPFATGGGRAMNPNDPGLQPFHVSVVDFQAALAELRAVRDEVFVGEQGVPVEIEHDALDPACTHVIARLLDGTTIGTARLTPDQHIGRMAVRAPWRGRARCIRRSKTGRMMRVPR